MTLKKSALFGVLLASIFVGQRAYAQSTTPVKAAPVFVPMPKDVQCELNGMSFRSAVGANAQLTETSGSVDGVTCWITGKTPEQKKDVPLASTEITRGMLSTKDFGKLRITPVNSINSSGVSIAIRRDKLPSFRAFLLEPEEKSTVGLPASIPERTVAITLENNSFKVGDNPMFLGAYTQSGTRGAGLSSDLRDAVLDLSTLPRGQWVPIAMQDKGGPLSIVCAVAPKLVITADGLVYPVGAKTMDAKGPFIRLMLFDKSRNRVDPKSLVVRAKGGSNEYNHWVSDDLVVISAVGREPIEVSVFSGPEEFDFVIFPFLRGATAELVAYNVDNVNIGKLLLK